jgi:predicted DNA-binding ribbon-helix-helix protein
MSTYRNVTLSLPAKVLRQLKRIAARRQTSISKLVTQTLEELAAREDAYARARDRHLAWLEQAPDLGTHGQIKWSRETLHER